MNGLHKKMRDCGQENTASYLKTEKEKILLVSAADKSGIYELKEELGALKGKEEEERKIVGDLLEPSDFVVLVVPIDSAAPKGTPDFATTADDS